MADETGYKFTLEGAKRIAAAVRQVEGTSAADMSGKKGAKAAPAHTFWAKLNAEDPDNPGFYSWKMQKITDGAFVDASPTVEDTDYSAFEANATTGVAGNYALLTFAGYDTGSTDEPPRYVFSIGGGGGDVRIFSVDMDGGSAGDSSTECSYTYTVYPFGGTSALASGVPLTGNGQRIVNVPFDPGTVGMGVINGDGTVTLVWVDERAQQTTCSVEP